MEFKKAVRKQRKLRAAIAGVSGSGKTYTALRLAQGLGKKIGLIDSERNSASLYGEDFDFDVLELTDLSINGYFEAIDKAAAAGLDVLIIDSASHAWEGVLERVEQQAARTNSQNTFAAWGKEGTPLYKEFLKKVLTLKMHVICTMRSKSDYVMEEYTVNGKTRTKPVKVGLAPEFRKGGEYEFDIVANCDLEHNFMVEKTRFKFLDNAFFNKAGEELGKKIADFLEGGVKEEVPTFYYNISAIANNAAVQAYIDSKKEFITDYITPTVIETNTELVKIVNYQITEEVAQELLKAYKIFEGDVNDTEGGRDDEQKPADEKPLPPVKTANDAQAELMAKREAEHRAKIEHEVRAKIEAEVALEMEKRLITEKIKAEQATKFNNPEVKEAALAASQEIEPNSGEAFSMEEGANDGQK